MAKDPKELEGELESDHPTGRATALAIASPGLVRPVATPEEFEKNETLYQEIVKRVLRTEDYQEFTERVKDPDTNKWSSKTKKRKVKSAWRKLARVFGLTVLPVPDSESAERVDCDPECCPDDCASGHYEVRVSYAATATNGQSSGGDGSCIDNEKWPTRDEWDEKVARAERERWSAPKWAGRNSRHNVRSTAHTRAYNRAVSNLIAAGEVSAEEITGRGRQQADEPPAKPKRNNDVERIQTLLKESNYPKGEHKNRLVAVITDQVPGGEIIVKNNVSLTSEQSKKLIQFLELRLKAIVDNAKAEEAKKAEATKAQAPASTSDPEEPNEPCPHAHVDQDVMLCEDCGQQLHPPEDEDDGFQY
jgi:hypothetical protein